MKTKGLSLAEAHASGKKYKRSRWVVYLRFNDRLFMEDALATDYELEPEAKLLTREEVYEAISNSLPVICTEYVAAHICDKLFGSEER